MVADNDFTAIAILCAVPLRRTCVSAPAVVPGHCRRRLGRELPGTFHRPEYNRTWGCFGSRRCEVTGDRCGEKQTARPVADLYTARSPSRPPSSVEIRRAASSLGQTQSVSEQM